MTGGKKGLAGILFGFSLRLFILGLIKLLPHLHINFKSAKELNHHGNELLHWFCTLNTMAIPKFIAGGGAAITFLLLEHYRNNGSEFQKGTARSNVPMTMEMSRSKSYVTRSALGACCSCFRAFAVTFFNSTHRMLCFCREYDFVVVEVIPETQQDKKFIATDGICWRIYCHDGFDVAPGNL
jgi:hypothetical protein